MVEEERKGDSEINDSENPVGIINIAKSKLEYKTLLQEFEIEELDSTQALKMIESKIAGYCPNNFIQRLMFYPDEMFN